jgi:hypothetical protein
MHKLVLSLTAIVAAATLVSACDRNPKETGESKQAASRPSPRPAQDKDRPREVESEEDHHGEHAARPRPVELPPDGHLGKPFTLEKQTPLAQIASKPNELKGKKVLISGKVVAQCTHMRRWFALSKDGSSPWVRVSTGPRFAIHSKAVGMKGKAEGTVVVRKISEKLARHFAKHHKMFGGDPEKIQGPQDQVVVQATAAQFTKLEE